MNKKELLIKRAKLIEKRRSIGAQIDEITKNDPIDQLSIKIRTREEEAKLNQLRSDFLWATNDLELNKWELQHC